MIMTVMVIFMVRLTFVSISPHQAAVVIVDFN